ncbi:DNA polymerase III subunit delta' [Parvibaculum sedimenti]|uniref:DNA polymerase III subunit delta n=1 Tax=Parvibaculum sedimenti TaxID=2608632 RepID=A0A6N6VH88_9HYPH|nr:DNA polymerase III subunit delta' [Parvibaculum sedimenti]KAB7739708.1 DNA polymerase III subunit delta' [Parvibaculum sedimenti]
MSDIPESDRLGDFPHPREVSTLIGQDEAERAVFDAFMGGRMHHAWLLTGPKGIGKATLAYRIARFLLRYGEPEVARAARAHDLSVPGDDAVFRQIAAQSHPNLLVIRRPYDDKAKRLKTVIPVEEVRRTSNFFGMSAGAGGWRVAIVDAADDMNVNAENALLKILEEPPARGLFILVSHQPGRLLPTIRSRCRVLTLKPLDAPHIADVLAANETRANAEERVAIGRLAEGSAGRALTIAAGGGLDLYRELVALLMPLPRLNVKGIHALADKVGRRGADEAYETFTDLLSDWLQRLVRTGAGADATGDIVAGEGAAMARLAGGTGLDRWVEVWEKINQSVARAEALNTDRKLVILNAFSMLESVAGERIGA